MIPSLVLRRGGENGDVVVESRCHDLDVLEGVGDSGGYDWLKGEALGGVDWGIFNGYRSPKSRQKNEPTEEPHDVHLWVEMLEFCLLDEEVE